MPFGDKIKSVMGGISTKLSGMSAKRNAKRVAKNVAKGNMEKAAKIAGKPAKRAAKITARGQKKSNKLMNKAANLTRKAKTVTSKSTAKAEKVSPTPKPKNTTTPNIAPVKTKRGTGKTYKSAWAGMSTKKKAEFKDYADFETKAKSYNRVKDSQKGSKGVLKSDANKKKPTGPQNKK